ARKMLAAKASCKFLHQSKCNLQGKRLLRRLAAMQMQHARQMLAANACRKANATCEANACCKGKLQMLAANQMQPARQMLAANQMHLQGKCLLQRQAAC
ncbi:hypothetical protein Tco_1249341, partial [Tanacetum coccineum]